MERAGRGLKVPFTVYLVRMLRDDTRVLYPYTLLLSATRIIILYTISALATSYALLSAYKLTDYIYSAAVLSRALRVT